MKQTKFDIVFGVDCDGTVVKHKYPLMGEDVPDAVRVLTRLVKHGHKLVINTMRSDKYLQDAIDWFELHNLPIYGANKNPNQSTWTNSPKVYADVYIDDAALGCPLRYDTKIIDNKSVVVDGPYVCWNSVEILLEIAGYLPQESNLSYAERIS